jgi:hypothetical protein
MEEENVVIKGYKGFDKELKCRGFLYEVDKEYEQGGEIKCCNNGFHFCENPFDVFSYYPPNDSRYCEVHGSGKYDKDNDDSKVSVSKIKIGFEIGLKGLIDAGIKFILDKVNWEESKATNTGNQSAATNTGDESAATNTGYQSAATNTGDRSAATNTGNRSAATNTGYQSAATNTGNQSAATNTGDESAATNTGNRSAATNTGYRSAASVEGFESIAIVTGYDCKAKGSLGCWIVLTERGEWDGNTYPIKCVKSFKVDGKKVKSNTWYKLINGKLTKCE